jgi:hypothetical protein
LTPVAQNLRRTSILKGQTCQRIRAAATMVEVMSVLRRESFLALLGMVFKHGWKVVCIPNPRLDNLRSV